MYEVVVKGFKTKAEAETFLNWYEGSAEQDIDIWLDCRRDEGLIETLSMNTNIQKTFPLKWNDNSLELHLKMQYDEEDEE